jgi:hypothetical protein
MTSIFDLFQAIMSMGRDVDLKRELVERGLSVEEIERIVAAKGSASRDGCV